MPEFNTLPQKTSIANNDKLLVVDSANTPQTITGAQLLSTLLALTQLTGTQTISNSDTMLLVKNGTPYRVSMDVVKRQGLPDISDVDEKTLVNNTDYIIVYNSGGAKKVTATTLNRTLTERLNALQSRVNALEKQISELTK